MSVYELKLRRSQLIVPFGAGSIVNMPNQSLMACGIDHWHNRAGIKIYDERLQRRLRVQYFKTPTSAESFPDGLPFVRFPQWLFCPKCRSFRSIDIWKERWKEKRGDDFLEPKCYLDQSNNLVPARFIIACLNGHIDDFPWIKWVHGDKECGNPDLMYKTGGSSAGLEGVVISCRSCPAKRSMRGSFDKEIFKRINFKCTGHMPWQKKHEACQEYPTTLQRGATNVYFPKLVSSIIIPPYSDSIFAEIRDTAAWSILSTAKGLPDERMKELLIPKIIEEIDKPKEQVLKAIEKMLNFGNGTEDSQTEIEYRYDEYRAFHGDIKKGEVNSKDFSIEIIENNKYPINGIKNVVLAHRLREIRALVSFSRIVPLDRDDLGISKDEDPEVGVVKTVSVREDPKHNWFPAIEVRGEGIFISFEKNKLIAWANNEVVKSRATMIQLKLNEQTKRYKRKLRKISPEYIFLHTFAHVLIRQLSFECGYSAASLKERIYSNENNNEKEMAAILIYTASGDAEGTLGGLVRQGKPDRLPAIIEKAIINSEWCSSDPICIESKGQGMGSLNLAACHSCVLLPENSCEENNRLLDRAMLVGLPENPAVGFLSNLL